MSKDVSFQLDTGGGQQILTQMVAPVIKQSAEAIAARARSMAGSISSDPPTISVHTEIQPSKRGGARVVGLVRATGSDAHENYIGHVALAKAKDAGRV
jgi:hypothetical protein